MKGDEDDPIAIFLGYDEFTLCPHVTMEAREVKDDPGTLVLDHKTVFSIHCNGCNRTFWLNSLID